MSATSPTTMLRTRLAISPTCGGVAAATAVGRPSGPSGRLMRRKAGDTTASLSAAVTGATGEAGVTAVAASRTALVAVGRPASGGATTGARIWARELADSLFSRLSYTDWL